MSLLFIQNRRLICSYSLFLFFRVQKTDLERVLEANDGSATLDEDEEDLQRALALSRQEIDMEDEEADLRRAIQLSMQGRDVWMCISFVVKGLIQIILCSPGSKRTVGKSSLKITARAVTMCIQSASFLLAFL